MLPLGAHLQSVDLLRIAWEVLLSWMVPQERLRSMHYSESPIINKWGFWCSLNKLKNTHRYCHSIVERSKCTVYSWGYISKLHKTCHSKASYNWQKTPTYLDNYIWGTQQIMGLSILEVIEKRAYIICINFLLHWV